MELKGSTKVIDASSCSSTSEVLEALRASLCSSLCLMINSISDLFLLEAAGTMLDTIADSKFNEAQKVSLSNYRQSSNKLPKLGPTDKQTFEKQWSSCRDCEPSSAPAAAGKPVQDALRDAPAGADKAVSKALSDFQPLIQALREFQPPIQQQGQGFQTSSMIEPSVATVTAGVAVSVKLPLSIVEASQHWGRILSSRMGLQV